MRGRCQGFDAPRGEANGVVIGHETRDIEREHHQAGRSASAPDAVDGSSTGT
jgi:hypothetical protein